jgi:hypothetical protein
LPTCYTCGEDITFNKAVLSKTGKQIPLWPDQRNTHSHDEDGKPIRKPLPNEGLNQQQTQQFNQYNRQPTFPAPPSLEKQEQRFQPTGGQSQGGGYMDTKRLRVMTEEIGKKQLEHDDTLQSIYALCRNNSNMLLEVMNHFKLVEPTTAAALHQQQQQNPDEKYRKEQEEIAKWNNRRAYDILEEDRKNVDKILNRDPEAEIVDDKALEKEGI